MKKSILILSGILCLTATTTFAHKPPKSAKETIAKLDANKDGKISKEETKGPLSKDFETIDVNKDGFLTETELDAFKPKKENLDTDGDGKISKTEAKGRLAKDFDKIDTDKDGFLSKEEMKSAKKGKKEKE